MNNFYCEQNQETEIRSDVKYWVEVSWEAGIIGPTLQEAF